MSAEKKEVEGGAGMLGEKKVVDSVMYQTGLRNVLVHPLVLLSVLDHFTRRTDGQHRVIGALLGNRIGNVVQVKSCFPVPHTEDTEVSVDTQNLFELHQQVYPNEEFVGWYSTGLKISRQSVLIHNYFWQEMDSSPVLLCVDTELKKGSMDIKAFESEPLGAVDASDSTRSIGFHFKPLQVKVDTLEFGRLGMAELSKSKSNDDALRTITSEAASTRFAFTKLREQLKIAQEYVDDVLAGKQTPDKETGRLLMDVVTSVPQLDRTTGEKRFNKQLQDVLMVGYLANLTRAQLVLAERLQFDLGQRSTGSVTAAAATAASVSKNRRNYQNNDNNK